MRDLPDARLFPNSLIDDMHKTFDAVCAKLRLAQQSDKATALVVTKIVELAKAGHRGDDLTLETLRSFNACEPERRADRPRPVSSIVEQSGSTVRMSGRSPAGTDIP
jgi:hypothetical protein